MSRRQPEAIGFAYIDGARVDSVYGAKRECLDLVRPTIELGLAHIRFVGQHAIVIEIEDSRVHITAEEALVPAEQFQFQAHEEELVSTRSHFFQIPPEVVRILQTLSQPSTRYDRPEPV